MWIWHERCMVAPTASDICVYAALLFCPVTCGLAFECQSPFVRTCSRVVVGRGAASCDSPHSMDTRRQTLCWRPRRGREPSTPSYPAAQRPSGQRQQTRLCIPCIFPRNFEGSRASSSGKASTAAIHPAGYWAATDREHGQGPRATPSKPSVTY